MPIRFRCVYCSQLLGISRRKAGQIVRCTHCEGQIIVPDPEPEHQTAAAGKSNSRDAGPKLFERSDIEELLKPYQAKNAVSHPTPAKANGPATAEDSSDVHPVLEPPRRPSRPAWLIFAGSTAAALVVFGLGFLLGRLSASW